ncbi:MAG TPA: hypothetical protein VF092_08085 [Longimicrobium sp.]
MVVDGFNFLHVCLVRDGEMKQVEAEYNPATGDTTVAGRLFREVYPVTGEYASATRWYAGNEPVTFAGGRYVKEGLTRVLNVGDVVPVGTYNGVTVFAEESDRRERPEALYFPVSPACLFQPYIPAERGYPVRG